MKNLHFKPFRHRLQRRRGVALRVIEIERGHALAVGLQYADQTAVGEVVGHQILRHIGQPQPGAGGGGLQIAVGKLGGGERLRGGAECVAIQQFLLDLRHQQYHTVQQLFLRRR